MIRKKKEKHGYDRHKSTAGKVWHFLWHEDSIYSLIADIVIVMLLGNFVIYPGLGALMGTNFPIVAVISGSMDHHGQDLDTWWNEMGGWYEQNGITQEEFQEFYVSDGFEKGDVLFVMGRQVSELEVGDVVVYQSSIRKEPIIHRIVDISGDTMTFSTKGDANSAQLTFEQSIRDSQLYGEAVFLIPKLGWVKVIFVELLAAVR